MSLFFHVSELNTSDLLTVKGSICMLAYIDYSTC
jgi:hypothetical protein